MMIIVSTFAVSTSASILIFLYHRWRKDFDLPLEENTFGSFWKILINATTYALSILVHQGIEAIVIRNMYLRKILWIYYSQFVERWSPFVPILTSLDVGTLATNDHNIYKLIHEHLDILFDCDQVEASSGLFRRVGRKFRPTDVSLNNAERAPTSRR